ncbi:MAG: DUF6065 family protein [Gemmobacter sp.]
MFLRRPAPVIRFTCAPEDHGVIAAPVPARAYLPDWFRKLPPVDDAVVSETNTGLTIKRCMPFLDAMTTGWLLTLPATVRLTVSGEGTQVEAGWDFDRELVSFHGPHQVKGNPMTPRPPCKFINFWTIETPPGWSCLFVNPLNRPNGVFEVIAGVVDTDTYRSPIHFPFFVTGTDGLHRIEKGSPIVQVIPFRRDTAQIEADIRAETPAEAAERTRILRNTQSVDGWYRTTARARR